MWTLCHVLTLEDFAGAGKSVCGHGGFPPGAVFSLAFLLCASGSSRAGQRDKHPDDIICPFCFPLSSSHHPASPDLVLLLLRLSEVIPSPRCDPNLGIVLLLISRCD